MAITVDTLKFYAAERMTDFDDGGGQMTANEIISGADNQIFDDISDVDRASGDLSLRKIYAAVTSADTDKYLDAGVVIFSPPADANTNVLQFSTGDYYDEREDWIGLLESSVSRGRRYAGWLYGQHIAGQRALLIWMRTGTDDPPSVGSRLNIAALSGGNETHTEFVWVTKVTISSRTVTDSQGQFVVDEITCDLAYPLQNAYTGIDPVRLDPATTAVSGLIYEVRYNPDLVTLAGIKPLADLASTGDYSIKVTDGLYQPLIPTGLQETALADTNPGGDSAALIGGAATLEDRVSFTTALNLVKPDGTLYLGRACLPGTLTIAVSGATLVDSNGAITLGGTVVGSVDYGNGIARFTSSCPSYGTASKVVSFGPAVRDLRVADTASIVVTLENRGYVYILTLAPIPAPGSLRVSYQVNGNWYVLYEQGDGLLSGVDSSYGSGNFNATTGTVTITTGELPDVDSLILFAWTTPVNYTPRGAAGAIPARFSGTLAHPGIVPGSVTASWSTITLAEPGTPDGTLTGTGGTGTIDYATGDWTVTPDALPAMGTEITIAYDYTIAANVKTETFTQPAREPDSSIILTLNETDIEPRSVRVRFNLDVGASANVWGGSASYRSFTVTVKDDGDGGLTDSAGTLDYVNGVITLTPDRDVAYPTPNYQTLSLGTYISNGLITNNLYRTIVSDWDALTLPAVFPPTGGSVTVEYRLDGDSPSTSDVFTFSQLEFDLTRGFAETIVSGSVDVTLGSSRYVSTAGQIYRDPSPETGAGTLAGSLDPTTGIVRLSNWTAGANSISAGAFVTVVGGQPVDACLFRSPVANLRPGSVQIRATATDGTVISETVPQSGVLETGELEASVNYLDGVISLRFGAWKAVADLTPDELLEPWYDAAAIIEIGGEDMIWKPLPVLADSIIYNAVAQSILPPDRDMIGIDASRLPPDGRALIFQQGKLALVHHTDTVAAGSLSPTQAIDCGRVRLYRVVIDDATGLRLPANFYSVNRETGIVTMAADLSLTGYTAPYALRHTVADLVRVTAVDINGTLSLNKALSHDYPADDSYASGVLYVGTLQARYANLFVQSVWTSVWSDERIGDAPLAQYNDTAYPIVVSNLGAYQDRILIQFTSSTLVRVVGENLGVIATNLDITDTGNIAPVNQLTGQPYFTLDYLGWGAGWSTGNCVRFNLIGANYPVDLIRAIQPSTPSGLDDSVELLFLGNTDSP